jgi:O-succinylbenzoic acid--CoA ligase
MTEKTLPEPTGPFLIDGTPFTVEELQEHAAGMAGDHALPGWERELFSFIRLFLDEGDEAIIQRTSGTTGDPGRVRLKRISMNRSAEMTLDFFRLVPGDRVLLCLPIDYIAGKMMVVRALVGRLDLVTTEPGSRPLKGIPGRFRFSAMVPLQVHESLLHGDPLQHLDQLLVGGGELHHSVLEAMKRTDRPEVYESFAMTETYSHFALRRINGITPDRDFRLLEGVRISRDERDCLEVEVPGVTEGKVVTRDLVEITPDGKGFRWLGRMDNVIKSGGVKLIPEVLEQRIGRWLNRPCLVLPEEDTRLGQRIVLLVETGEEAVPVQEWQDLLRRNLPGYEMPRRIVTVREIPRNPSFKPDRKAAIRLLRQGY